MSDRLIDVRVPLAVSESVRVELGEDGTLHLVTPSLTLHLTRPHCEELATTLARGMVRLRKLDTAKARPFLRVIDGGEHGAPTTDEARAPSYVSSQQGDQ
jgi:hypothetical protein